MKVASDTEISSPQMAAHLGLSAEEYQHVCKHLDRQPNVAELGIFSAMFSEHCSYKSSKSLLRKFPTAGKRVLQGPGENAGVVSIGHGWAVAFKMESHNHPSFIEPYQGAATGMGGILRDIFTMGARPIASMNALCFGSLDFLKTASLVKGVVEGIGGYGNSVGVPTVAGQTLFHSCYNKNPLVNAFTIGLLREDKIFRGKASGVGNLVVYAGSKTGRDGVHGATMASKEFSSEKELERPTVQVGDPFTEKLLLEATLEAMRLDLIIGIQDMGAAGLTSSSFEMAERAGTGLEIDLSRIPVREQGMTAYELLLSESQERMLLVTEPPLFEPLKKVFEKWDLHLEQIGEVVEGNRVKMSYQGKGVVDLPVDLVTKPLITDPPRIAPPDLKQRWFLDRNRLLVGSLSAKFQCLLEDLNVADPRPIVEQYDSMVGNRNEGGTYDDAAVLRIREIEEKTVRLALSVDCNPPVCWLWPKEGGRRAVAEAATNLAVKGALPIGITDCLNFGSPESPEVMWQLEECIEGIAEACRALSIPVISGNVSLYNETDSKAIYPTPMIGIVGLIEDESPLPPSEFFSTDLEIGLIGPKEAGLGGSLLARSWFKRDCGRPDETDLKVLERTLKFLSALRKKKFVYAAHDISEGGLILAALEMAFRCSFAEIGFELSMAPGTDADRFLFGESIPRILLAYEPVERTEIEQLAGSAGVTFSPIGQSTDTRRMILRQGGSRVLDYAVSDLKKAWLNKWTAFFKI